jgi:hypothetical protein
VNYAQLYVAIQSYVQNYDSDFITNIPTFVREAERRIYNSVQLAYLRKTAVGALSIGGQYLTTPADFLSTYSLSLVKQDGTYEFLIDKDITFMRQAFPNPTTTGQPQYYALFGPTVSGGQLTNGLAYQFGPTPDYPYQLEINYYYYPPSIVAGVILTVGSLVGGSGYTNGTWYDVQLTGGAGASATATLTIAGGVVTNCVVESGGSLYLVGNTLSSSDVAIGNGSGFSVNVATINNSTGTSWLGENYEQVLLYGCLVEAYGFMKGETDMMTYYMQKFDDGIQQLRRLGDGLERGDAYRDGQFKRPVGA